GHARLERLVEGRDLVSLVVLLRVSLPRADSGDAPPHGIPGHRALLDGVSRFAGHLRNSRRRPPSPRLRADAGPPSEGRAGETFILVERNCDPWGYDEGDTMEIRLTRQLP